MKSYLDLLKTTLETGTNQFNTRTSLNCKVLVGTQVQFDLSKGFPAVTTKKLAFDSMKGELLGFFRGYTNAAQFRALGCKIWDKNANETKDWLSNPARKGHDDLGRIYGKQWTSWSHLRAVPPGTLSPPSKGWNFVAHTRDGGHVESRTINQLENALHAILTTPSDRRIIISAWNPGELDLMALPPCHMDYRFVPFEREKILHVVMTIRSWDLFLGAPFNIASTALFLAIMARLSGYKPGTVTIQATNAHIYENHYEQVREQLGRNCFPPPELYLSNNIAPVTSLDQIPGIFTRIEPQHAFLISYRHHQAIKAEMAA